MGNQISELRKCSRCGSLKQLWEFCKDRQQKSGLSLYCKKCRGMLGKKYYEKVLSADRKKRRQDPNWQKKRLDYDLKRYYGISLDTYLNMVAKQKGVCLICGRSPKIGQRLNVDHNHITGKFRGLICGDCNRGLGYFHNNPGVLRLAANYLEERE